MLTFDRRDNAIDMASDTDVVLHLRYTARSGAPDQVRDALGKLVTSSPRTLLISARSAFGDAYYRFFNPGDASAAAQTLALPLDNATFPFSNRGAPQITGVSVAIVLSRPLTQAVRDALTGGVSVSGALFANGITQADGTGHTVTLKPKTFDQTGLPQASDQIATLFGDTVAPTAATAPGPVTLTIGLKNADGSSALPASLQTTVDGQTLLDAKLIADIVLLVDYELKP
jgi:hypothetical protein